MAKFLDLLKMANNSRNRQAHRVVSNTKRGRQMLAEYKDSDKLIIPSTNNGEIDARENRSSTAGRSDSKTNI